MKEPLIYIIDNDLVSAFEIGIRLHQSKMRCNVTAFSDIKSALEMLETSFNHEEGLPDIMLVSFDMPGMDRDCFLDKFKNNPLISNNTDLYVFSSFGISNAPGKFDSISRIKRSFTKPLSKKDIQKIFQDFQNRIQKSQISA